MLRKEQRCAELRRCVLDNYAYGTMTLRTGQLCVWNYDVACKTASRAELR